MGQGIDAGQIPVIVRIVMRAEEIAHVEHRHAIADRGLVLCYRPNRGTGPSRSDRRKNVLRFN
jgi:hypothetical protein